MKPYFRQSYQNIISLFRKTNIYFAASPTDNSELVRTRLISHIKHQICHQSSTCLAIRPLNRKFPIEQHTWNEYLQNAPKHREELLRTRDTGLMIWLRIDRSGKRLKLQAIGEKEKQEYIKPCGIAISELEPVPVESLRHFAPIMALFTIAQIPCPKRENKKAYRDFSSLIKKLCGHLDQELSSPSENMPASFTTALKKLQAWAWAVTGAATKDSAKLGRAIRAFETILKELPQSENEFEHGQTLSNLANLSLNYAHCHSSIDAYEQAVENVEKAQTVFTRVKYPFLWAQLQEIKAEAQISLGERYNDTDSLENSIHTLKTIKRVWSSLQRPERLACVQKNIGDVLYKLGLVNPGTEQLEQASSAYHGAINAWQEIDNTTSSQEASLALAQTLVALGERTGSRERLEEAVQLSSGAAKFFSALSASNLSSTLTEAHALTLIGCQFGSAKESALALQKSVRNLNSVLRNKELLDVHDRIRALELRGTALGFLGASGNSDELLEESSINFQQAVTIIDYNIQNGKKLTLPFHILGRLHSHIARNLACIARHSVTTDRLEQAETAYRNALSHTDKERMSRDWAVLQSELADLQIYHARRQNGQGSALIDEAIQSCHQALSALKRDRAPTLWAQMKNKLAEALTLSGAMGGGTPCLELAVDAYNKVLEDWKPGLPPLERASTLNNMANVLADIARREVDGHKLELARRAFSEAYDIYTSTGHLSFAERVHDNITAIDELIDNDFRVNTTLVFAHSDKNFGKVILSA